MFRGEAVFFLFRRNNTEQNGIKKGIKKFMVPSDKPYNFLQGLIPFELAFSSAQ